MDNWKLQQKAEESKEIIDSLIGNIEDLEGKVGQLEEEKADLLKQIEAFEEQVKDLESIINNKTNY